MTHWMAESEASKSRMRVGIATVSTVASSTVAKMPRPSPITPTHQCGLGLVGSGWFMSRSSGLTPSAVSIIREYYQLVR